MRKRIVAAVLALAMLCSGCSSVSLDPQTLMRPPRATGNKEKIHQVLEAKTNGQIKLSYPRRGDYRSAILMWDLTGDGKEDAIALYENADQSGGVTISFIRGGEEEWTEIGSFRNAATQVDKVCFGDVNRDGLNDVIVGWGSALNQTSSISIFSYKDGKMTELSYNQPYNEMEVRDFDNDTFDEIFTASVSTADQAAIARLLRVTDNMVETIGSAHLDNGVTRYASVTAGMIDPSQFGIVLDGAKSGGNYVTEVLFWDSQKKLLQSPFFDVGTQTANFSLRNTNVVSRDINGDTLIEIPIVNPMPGYSLPLPDEACAITNWQRYDCATDNLHRVMGMVINQQSGYWFLIPEMWQKKITVKVDREARSLTFYEWLPAAEATNSNVTGAVGTGLLKIQEFTQEEWNAGIAAKGFYKLEEKNAVVYAASILQPDHALALNINDITNSFRLISSQE
ncbi:FG-GAP repeat domain-containing protein [Clostridium minihomine]|uniref:FG-GAP repeat domain-containing protein n=1 Tax=Clostridium minihomine TaxID=2045012 RepID=UPI000C794BE9|nr:VCBS repeat-containing protein [Clostridium minihomine]